jgi:hypothetical protein
MDGMRGEQIEMHGQILMMATFYTCTLLFHQSAHHRVIIAREREKKNQKDPHYDHT